MGNLVSLWSNTGDLWAMQKMIDHVNHTVEHDFADVQELSQNVKVLRANLDNSMTSYRNALTPACKDFTEQRAIMFKGKGGQQPLSDTCLEAQGHMKTMLALDFPISGCDEVCGVSGNLKSRKDWVESNTSLKCDHGPCRGTLRCVRQLEEMIGGTLTKQRDAEVESACNTAGFDMYVNPPVGLNPEPEGLEAGSLCGKPAGGASQSSMSGAVLPALMAPPSFAKHEEKRGTDGSDCKSASGGPSQVLKGLASLKRIQAQSGSGRKHGSQAGQVFL